MANIRPYPGGRNNGSHVSATRPRACRLTSKSCPPSAAHHASNVHTLRASAIPNTITSPIMRRMRKQDCIKSFIGPFIGLALRLIDRKKAMPNMLALDGHKCLRHLRGRDKARTLSVTFKMILISLVVLLSTTRHMKSHWDKFRFP